MKIQTNIATGKSHERSGVPLTRDIQKSQSAYIGKSLNHSCDHTHNQPERFPSRCLGSNLMLDGKNLGVFARLVVFVTRLLGRSDV